MSCKPFKTSEANAKSYLRTQGVIDKFLNIKDLGKFREFHSILRGQAKDKYFPNVQGWNEKLFLEEQGGKKIVPNKVVFKQIDNINGVKYSKFTTTGIDPQNVESILTMLSDKFSIPFETINDPKQDYSGKFEDGRVYVNLAHVTPETAWHEFAHPFIEQVKEDNPKLYRSLVNEIQTSTYGKQVLAEVKSLYPELNEEEQIEEAIVETIARFVTGKVSETELKENKTFFQKVLDFVQKIKDTLAAALNVGNVNIVDLDNDFTLKHMAEIMQHGGRLNLDNYKGISKTKQIVTVNSETITDKVVVMDIIRLKEAVDKIANLDLSTNNDDAVFSFRTTMMNFKNIKIYNSNFRNVKNDISIAETIAFGNKPIPYFTKATDDEIKAYEEAITYFKKISQFLNEEVKIEEKKDVVQYKNQYTTKDLDGVYHNIGAWMNSAGVLTVKDAIDNLTKLLTTGNRVELAAYSGKARIPLTMGNLKISFKNEAPVSKSYLTDVSSNLFKNKKGEKERVAQFESSARENADSISDTPYDEVFINATSSNVEELVITDNISVEELNSLKELSDLTGAPIVENGKVVYQPTTVKPYKGQAVKYSKFYKGGKSTSSEFFVTSNKEYAKEYGDVSEVDVDLGNVLDLADDYNDATYGSAVVKLLESKGVTFTQEERNSIIKNNLSAEPLFSIIGRNPEIKNAVKRSGFNSIKQLETKTTDKYGRWDNSTLNESYFVLSKPQTTKYSKFGVDKKVKAELNKVTDTLVTYLSNYGITIKDISEIKDTLKIDEVGFADILSKIAYIKNEENLPAVAGEFIAYMMQHNGLIQSMVKNFAAANNELKYTRNAIYYVASGLGKSVLAEKNPNKFADMDELVKNAVIKATGSSYDTSTNSKLIFENDLVQKYLKEEIEKVMETKVILSPIDPEKIKLLGFNYKKHYVPTKKNVSKIVAGIKSRTTNPYEISDENYVKRYVTPYTSDEKVEAVEVGGYIVDEFDDVNDLSELLNQYLDRSEYNQADNYKDLNKTEYFKIIGKLVAERLHKKINEKLSTKLLNAIKDIIKQFFGLLNRGPKKYDAQRMISASVEAIVNAIISNDKNFITKSIYKPGAEGKPISQVSVEQALETDPFGKSIIYKLSEYGFILTGSTALSEQGTILRPDENPLHDIDWVSPFTEQDTHEKFLDAYPEAIWFRDIDSEDQVTKSYVIAPDGHHIQNHVITTTPAGKVFIDSYEVVNDEGEIVGTYKLVTTNGKPKEVEWGVKGKVIDFFTYKNVSEAVEKEPMKFKTKDGVTMLLSNWKSIFKAKLAWARYKDIWDYNRFVPNVQKNDEESVSLQINELIREGIITAKCN